MRLLSIFAIVFCNHQLLAQKFTSSIHFSVLYDDTRVHHIPSYVEAYGLNFPVRSQGIYNTSAPRVSMEVGYKVVTNWGLKKIYTGVTLGYRNVDLSYIDKNLYYLKLSEGEVTEIYFEADIKQHFAMIQLPVGVAIPLVENLEFDFAARNNFIVNVSSTERINDTYFSDKQNILDRRGHNNYMLELSAGIRYSWPRYAIGLKYIQALTSLYPDIANVDNQIIPSKLYFSSVSISFEVSLGKLFRQDNE